MEVFAEDHEHLSGHNKNLLIIYYSLGEIMLNISKKIRSVVLLSALLGFQQQTKPLTKTQAHIASAGIALCAGLSMCAYDHLYKKQAITKELVTKNIGISLISWFIAHAYLRTQTDTWKLEQEAATLEANQKSLETGRQTIKELEKEIPQPADILNHALRTHQQPWALKLAAESADVLIQRAQAIQTQLSNIEYPKLAGEIKQLKHDITALILKGEAYKDAIIKHPHYAQHLVAYNQHMTDREQQQAEIRHLQALGVAQQERRRQETLAQQAQMAIAAAVATERIRAEGQLRQEREQLARQIATLTQRIADAQQNNEQLGNLQHDRTRMTNQMIQLRTRIQELERQLAQNVRQSPTAPAQEEAIVCTICAENIEDINANSVIRTQCGHTFHGACLNPWITSHNTCPNCRQNDPLVAQASTQIRRH